jgi:hypothetical protein
MDAVFLLGAGASAEAGVPLMNRFVSDLREEIDADLRAVLDPLVENLRPAAPEGIVDVEILLGALNQLRSLKENLTAAALRQQTPEHLDLVKLEQLDTVVRAHVRRRCSEGITPGRLEYLRPLLDFLVPSDTMDIFSLNYDMCIEMLAEKAGVRYTDGFDLYWRDAALGEVGQPGAPLVRLHKIHGSLVWYERSAYRYVKMPILPTDDGLSYFDHEPVAQMMLYPALVKQGSDRGPYPFLVHRFRTRLSSARTLVVVGYGFRDTYIRTLVVEAAMQNRRLSIVLVDPIAPELKRRYFSGLELAHRVVAHSAVAADALREGALYRFIRDLDQADSYRYDAEQVRPINPGSAKQMFKQATRAYMSLGHYDAVRVMIEEDERVNPEKAVSWDHHPLTQLDACLAFALAEGTAPSIWWRLAVPLLYWWERELLQATPDANRAKPEFMLGVVPSVYACDVDQAQRVEAMVSMYETAWVRLMRKQYPDPRLRPLHSQLRRLLDLERLRREPTDHHEERMQRQTRLIDDYLGEESAGNLAWQISQADIPQIPGLNVDWEEMRLVLSDQPDAARLKDT